MARIKIKDLSKDTKVSKKEMKAVCGGGISILGGGASSIASCGISYPSAGGFQAASCGISYPSAGGFQAANCGISYPSAGGIQQPVNDILARGGTNELLDPWL